MLPPHPHTERDMKTYGILTAAALAGAGLTMSVATSASAADIFGHRQGTRTIIHEEIDDARPTDGFRDIRFGDVDQAPRYRTRRVVREIYEYEDDDDLDD